LTVAIVLDGERRTVDVRRDGDQWIATIDGREIVASVVEVGGRSSWLLRQPDDDASAGRSYEVSVEARGGGDRVVHVNGEAIPLSIDDPRAFRRRSHEGGGADTGPASIVAPMPGRIVKVLVRPGDTVAARQGVVVVEAMKMENELRAPRAGRVSEVRVTEGASVEARAVLLVLE
jgi:biotin carboxyl carrier protein